MTGRRVERAARLSDRTSLFSDYPKGRRGGLLKLTGKDAGIVSRYGTMQRCASERPL